jgi:hypothetical protein
VSGEAGGGDERRERLKRVGLHFCSRYRNLVRFDPEFCGRCPFNGLRDGSGAAPGSETCF